MSAARFKPAAKRRIQRQPRGKQLRLRLRELAFVLQGFVLRGEVVQLVVQARLPAAFGGGGVFAGEGGHFALFAHRQGGGGVLGMGGASLKQRGTEEK